MSIRIPQEVHDWLRERAFTERRSINAVVAEVLTAASPVKPREWQPKTRLGELGAAVSRGELPDELRGSFLDPDRVSETPETR